MTGLCDAACYAKLATVFHINNTTTKKLHKYFTNRQLFYKQTVTK